MILLLSLLIEIRPPPTPEPTRSLAATPSRSPMASFTPTQSVAPSSTPQPTSTLITQKVEREKKTYTVFIAIVCAGIVALVVIVVTVSLIKKKNSRIYPKTDSDENDPDGISVTVPRIYAEKTYADQEIP